MSTPPPSAIPSARQGVSLVDRINLFFHYRRYIKMIARRWFLLVVAILIFGGYNTYKAMKTPDTFQAGGKIEVKSWILLPGKARNQEEIANFYQRQLAHLNNEVVMSRVRNRITREANPLSPPAPASPGSSIGPSILQLVATSTDGLSASNFVRIWAEEFIKYKREQQGSNFKESLKNEEKDEVRLAQELKRAQEAKTNFQRQHNTTDLDEAARNDQAYLNRLQIELLDTQKDRQALENQTPRDIANGGLNDRAAKPDNKDQAVSSLDPLARFAAESSYTTLNLKLRKTQKALEDDGRELLDAHPHMQALKKEKASIEADIQAQLDLLAEKQKSVLLSLREKERNLQKAIDAQSKKMVESLELIANFQKLKNEEARLQRDWDEVKKNIDLLKRNAEEEDTFTLIGTVSPAYKIGPNRSKMILTGLLLGIISGVGLIYFLDRLDDRLELAEEIETKLGHPVLGQIPQVSAEATKGQALLLTKLDEHNVFSESVRGVRSAVLLGARNDGKNVILATSAVPGDGKTTFTVNFSVTLALANHRVLLVDADLRRGNTHNFFGNNRAPGFSEVLLGELHWTDVLRQTEIETLKVIHSGRLPSNPGELMLSPITKEFLTEVQKDFDYVVFDCPPLTAIDDTFTLLPLSTGLIFVVRSGQTSMRFAKNALTALRQRGAKILGLVVNGITPDNPYYYYQHYYHGYYTRGQPQPTDVRTTPMPASKMAAPRRGPSAAQRIRSIEAEALGSANATRQDLAEKEKQKAALYKARRQRTTPAGPIPSDTSVEELKPPGQNPT